MKNEPRIGDVKIVTMIHPDTATTRIWMIKQYGLSPGKYATKGKLIWMSARELDSSDPFTNKKDAIAFALSLNPNYKEGEYETY